ncbi:hypothetical protein CJ030_MR1G028872 [Morella rubra]|uniref:Phorbol-ester/DAG-type domain-containing protein n=1 Tax=Morella rubra TaxID=262757 RepID=A0A6A1WS35_9ROSI|nr:hypothetical protein CJ030_MR1G028872 [Morella rubra]
MARRELFVPGARSQYWVLATNAVNVTSFFINPALNCPWRFNTPCMMHPNHTLTLRTSSVRRYCDASLKNCTNCFFYNCNSCWYDLDIKCASERWRIDTDNSHQHQHQHVFTHFFKQIQFTCEACGEECKDIDSLYSLCSICQFLVHTKCANFPSTIKIAAHNHTLAHTYSLRQVKELPANDVFCRLCYKKINPSYAAYYCQECDYVAHAICTYDYYAFVEPLREGKEAESGLEEINLKGDEEAAGEIKHFSHQHNLVLNCEELRMRSCVKDHKYDKHPLKLTYAVEDDSEEYFCVLCEKERIPKHCFYNRAKCDFDAHTQCVRGRFPYIKWGSTYMYDFHEHPLTYVRKAKYSPPCKSCDVLSEDCFFECDQCKATNWSGHICNS